MKKSNKLLIVVAILLLNVLVVWMIGQSLLGKVSKYDKTLNEARSLAKQELCGKALDKYEEALALKDNLDVRIEMLDVYKKGINTGELDDLYGITNAVEEIINAYSKKPLAYEKACEFFMENEKYAECAEALMLARELKVNSKKIEKLREEVRYKFEKRFSMYETLLPDFGGYYTVSTGGEYSYLDGTASPEGGNYTDLTPFAEGYAFAKAIHSDGSEKSFIIDLEGKRQAYIKNAELSTGVGAAKDKSGDKLLLLACKVGKKYKYFNINGKEAFGEYEFAGRFRNNVAAVMESEGKWKLIDGTGKAIVNKTFTDVVLNEYDECAPKGIIIANDGNGYHLYNHKGEQIGKFTCDGAKAYVDGYIAFKEGEKWGFVDTEGKVVIQPQYEDAKSFSNRMGAVKNGEYWSFINPDNKVVIEDEFEDVDYLNGNGVCFVKIDEYWSNLEFYYTGL